MAYRKVGRVEIGENQKYDRAIEILMKMKINPEQLAQIFGNSKHINSDTFIIKMANFLDYMTVQRNIGISSHDKAYITVKDVMKMISKNYKIMQRDIGEDGYIPKIISFLDTLPGMNKEKTNLAIMNPKLHEQSYDRLVMQCAILENFYVREKQQLSNLVEYCLINSGKTFINSPQLLLGRLCEFKRITRSSTIEKSDYNYINISKKRFEQKYHISDEELAEQYPLPNVTGKTEEEIRQLMKEIIEGKRKKEEIPYKETLKIEVPQKRRSENRDSRKCEIEKEV